jgi:hypothetical protein
MTSSLVVIGGGENVIRVMRSSLGGTCGCINLRIRCIAGDLVVCLTSRRARRPKDEVCIISRLTTFNLSLGVCVCVPFK